MRELLQLDVAGAGHQADRAHDPVGAEFTQIHVDLPGHRLGAQFRAVRAFEVQRLGQVLEAQRAAETAVDGHLPGDVLQLHVASAALQIEASLHIHGANQVAVAEVQAHVAAHLGKPHVAVAAVDLDVALDVAYLVVARGAARFHRQPARHGHFQIVGHALIAHRAILIGAHHQAVALRDDLHRGRSVGAVGILALVGVDQLTPGHRHVFRIAARHFDVAARVLKHDALHTGRAGRGRHREVVLLTPEIQAAAHKSYAVLTRLPDAAAGDADQDHQHDFAARETAAHAFAIPDQPFDQPQQAPGDQHERPILRQQVEHRSLGVQVPPQEECADAKQQQWSGKRSSHTVPPGGGGGVCSASAARGALAPKPPLAGGGCAYVLCA